MAYDTASSAIVLFGGLGSSGSLGDTWTWNGASWSQVAPSLSPPARAYASMAYDEAAEQVLLFGGSNATGPLNDTWSWQGGTWTQLSPAASPPARSNTTMIYDGATQTVLLFGGVNQGASNSILNDTWSWNGSAWAQLCTSAPCNATLPSARFDASMAYDAATSTVVLFGGEGNSGALGDTWIWNGTTWAQLSPATSPPGRAGASAAYDAATSTVLLFGGGGNCGPYCNDTWSWNGMTWAQLSPATSPTARAAAGIAYDTATSNVFLFGGCCAYLGGLPAYWFGDTWNWNGNSWVPATGSAPTIDTVDPASGPTTGGTAVTILGTGFSTTAGATTVKFGPNASATVSCSSTTQCTALSPAGNGTVDASVTTAPGTSGASGADRFSYPASGTTVTIPGTQAWTDTGIDVSPGPSLLVATTGIINTGGSAEWTPAGAPGCDTPAVYSPAFVTPGLECWSLVGRIGTGAPFEVGTSAMLSPVAAGRLYLGVNDNYFGDNSGSWTATVALAPPTIVSISPTSGPATGGTAVTLTGTGFTGATAVKFGTTMATSFTVNSDTQISATSPAGSGTVDATVTTPDGTSAASGVDQFTYLATAPYTWQPVTEGSTLPSPRAGYAMAFDNTLNRLVLYGGTCAGFACSDTWQYDSTGWHQIATTGPSAREDAQMAYDSGRQRAVIFGGHVWAGDYLDDTWELNGSVWTQVSTAHAPSGRSNEAIAYDSTRGKTVLFGGWTNTQTGNDIFGDTWEYNGSDWSQITTAHSPSPRAGSRMVFVPAWGKMVLFGGYGGAAGHLNDTWLYDGQDWSQVQTTAAPSGRYDYQLAYDPARNVVVLFGGYNGSALDDTWEFDGSNWTLATPTTQPPATWDATVVYAGLLNGTVMFGGNSPNQNDLQNTMWLYGATATSTPAPTVTGISPSQGPATGGTAVTITGTGFTGATAVKFGTTPATFFTVNSDTQIAATSPAESAGTVDITVTTPAGTSAACGCAADQLSYTTGASETVGGALNGGYNTSTALTVKLDGTVCSAASAVLTNTASGLQYAETIPGSCGGPGQALTFFANTNTPLGLQTSSGANCVSFAPGTTTIGVTLSPNIPQSTTCSFVSSPAVAGVSPASGPAAGGTAVTITGTGLTGTTAVRFGASPTTSFSVNSDTQVTATSPAGAVDTTVDVTVTTPNGTSATSAADQFTYTTTTSAVNFVIAPASSTIALGASQTVAVQAQIATGSNLGSWTLTVGYDNTVLHETACDGGSFSTVNCNFGGTNNTIKLTGSSSSGLMGTQTLGDITFNGIAQASDSPVTLAAQTCTDNAGVTETCSATNGTISVALIPTVTALSQPTSGPPAGGTVVTITGTNFSTATNGTTVKFGANAATNVSCASSTICLTTSPAGSGTVDITVTVAGQASATSSVDQFSYASTGPYAGVSVQPATAFVPLTSGSTTVTLQAQAPAAGLGAWTIDVQYDPSIVQVTACAGSNGSLCNAAFASNKIRVAGSSSGGLTGSQPLATMTFVAASGAASNSLSNLTPAIITFTDPSGNPISATPFKGTITVGKLGDVNGDGSVTAVDSLCVLRMVAGLASTTACPIPPHGNPIIALNEQGATAPTAVDSLCILRGVAGLPATSVCPLITAPIASPDSAEGAAAHVSGPAQAELSLQPSAVQAASGHSRTVQVQARALTGSLGAWTVDVGYDPKTIKITDCKAENGSVCSASFASGVVRITGASASGLSSEQTLAVISFETSGGAARTSPLQIRAQTLTNAEGKPLTINQGTEPPGTVPTATPAPPVGGRPGRH